MHRRDGCLEGILKLVLLTALFGWRITLALDGAVPAPALAVVVLSSSSLFSWPAASSPAPIGSACSDRYLLRET